MAESGIELTVEPRVRPVGSGTVRRLLPWRERRMVGPFAFLDIMGPADLAPGAGMDVDAHPHIGLSTLTYLLAGKTLHRDSTGAVSVIDAGSVNWMTAGEGVTHTERTAEDQRARGGRAFGLQTWVALPDGGEDVQPFFEHADAADVPTERSTQSDGHVDIRLVAGSGWGMASPISGSSPLILAELVLDGGTTTIESDAPELAVLALDGSIELDGTELVEGTLSVLEPGADPAVSGHGTAMVLGGEPLGKRFIWWNFVHSDKEVIEEAKHRWAAGRFPEVPEDNERHMEMPGDIAR